MNVMTRNLKNNTTPQQYTLAGINLIPSRASILAEDVAQNTSLVCLHLARKGIKDPEGVEFAKMLLTNKTIKKLELEGNFLGANSAREFGTALKVNNTLLLLDLENNYLVNVSGDDEGVKAFTDCLNYNKTLLSLNMGNNAMDPKCGQKFMDATTVNTTLISFEFGMNDFNREQVITIQDNLNRNKMAYDEERFREWKERKRMESEESEMRILVTAEQERIIREEENEKSQLEREKQRAALWK